MVVRVLQVLGRLDRGGAETLVMNIYRTIDKNKFQFDFAIHTDDECEYTEEILSMGGKIFNLPRYKGINHFEYKKSWYNLLTKNKDYKIIHGHMRSTASIYLSIAKKFGLSTIAHSHSTSSGSGVSARIKNVLQIPIRHISDNFFACSYQAGKWLFGDKACKKDNFYIFNNAIPSNRFVFSAEKRSALKEKLNLKGNFVIGVVSRLEPVKNHKFILDVFSRLVKYDDKYKLLLIGNGSLEEEIHKYVAVKGLGENVIMLGSRGDISELMNVMDLFVLPSKYEGLGMSVIEAQSSGLPCLVSDNIPEEAFITDLIKALKLDEKLWVDEILKIEKQDRVDTSNYIKRSGFDIKNNTQWLQEFYSSLI